MYTVSFHNFKSQNFKVSVSNPETKDDAHLSVLSQNSNCQGLGRKNKHDSLKTDRISSGDLRAPHEARVRLEQGLQEQYCICKCMYVCMYIYIYIYIYTYVYA